MTAIDRTAGGCVALLAAATVGYLWVPTAALLTWYNIVAVAAVCLGFAGIARHRPARKAGWLLVLSGFAGWVLGDLVWALESSVLGWTFYPLPSDAVYLTSYAALALGVLLLVRTRERGGDVTALLDALIVTTGAAVLAGVFLVAPLAEDSSLSTLGKLVSAAYPVADVLVLAILVRLYATPGAGTAAFRLLGGALLLTLAGDVAWNVTLTLTGDTTSYRWTDMLWLGSYVAPAAAAWAPSMRGLADPAPRREGRPVTRRRLVGLTAGLMLPAVALVLDGLDGGRVLWPVIGAGSLVLSGLVLWRMAGLLGTVQVQAVQLAALARADALTGAPNRRTWDHELSRACQHSLDTGEPLSIALLDLDHFKTYNDTLGHQAGDLLLREAVAVWTDALDGVGFLARYGGEEFAVLLPDMTPEVAKTTVDAMRVLTPGGQTFSAGIALWEPGTDPGAAVARADDALYEAKRSGRDRVVLSDPDLGGLSAPSVIALQPIVQLGSGVPIGAEALSRFGDRNPADVFAAAHLHGNGAALEAAAVSAALAHRQPGRLLSVNVGLAVLGSPELAAVLPADLDGIVFEVTEHEDMLDCPALLEHIRQLRERGARIAVDDWGRGFSNLERVMALQPEIVKLDMSVVQSIGSDYHRTVVRALASWAADVGAVVCAEGIETEEQHRMLEGLGVQTGQGFLFGRPEVPQSATTTYDAAVAETTGR